MRFVCWITLALLACGPASKTQNTTSKARSKVHFLDKSIDLAPYLEGYPYRPALPIWSENTLIYDVDTAKKHLHRTALDFEQHTAMESGTKVSSIDWNTRTRWGLSYHHDQLYFLGDESNDEVINLYRLDLAGGTVEALTTVPYTYGYQFSPDEKRIAWLPRKGEHPFVTCLATMDPDGSNPTEHVCDTPKATFTWGSPSWAPDGRGVVVRVNINGQRQRGNLAWISWENPQPIILTETNKTRTSTGALVNWLDNSRFVYRSDESGFDAIGIYDLNRHVTKWLYTTETSITHSEVVEFGEEKRILLIEHSPIQDKLILLSPLTGKIIQEKTLDAVPRLHGKVEDGQALLEFYSNSSPFSLQRLEVKPDGFELKPWLALPNTLQSEIVQCDVQRVSFPTFDKPGDANENRMLHAYLYTPKNMANAADHLVRITSFYGGENRFSRDTQIFCEAGVVTFSPAVRGSWGFGTDFYRLNDGDLGGDEIADLFFAARWLESQGYDPKKIGVFGRSHGGYATMRALTFPPGTNGHDEVFPFAFGLADAGFSDIISFYENCNIPDWVLLEAGDPATEPDKLRDRSPINHIDKLQAPLFLSHGENDNRVPVAGSRTMNEACLAAKKPCTYVEFAGQGHRVRGLNNERKLYQERFSFLEKVLKPNTPAP